MAGPEEPCVIICQAGPADTCEAPLFFWGKGRSESHSKVKLESASSLPGARESVF